ncbi:hypothetical protein Droror1_Dr00028291 [Drosera rotundifolia]
MIDHFLLLLNLIFPLHSFSSILKCPKVRKFLLIRQLNRNIEELPTVFISPTLPLQSIAPLLTRMCYLMLRFLLILLKNFTDLDQIARNWKFRGSAQLNL